MPTTLTKPTNPSRRTRADVIACVASLVDALACLTFLFLQLDPTSVGRLYIASLIDPITCVIGYWVIFGRLRSTRPILADFGISILILGTVFLTCQNAVAAKRGQSTISDKSISRGQRHNSEGLGLSALEPRSRVMAG
jgi:hypothetical protein